MKSKVIGRDSKKQRVVIVQRLMQIPGAPEGSFQVALSTEDGRELSRVMGGVYKTPSNEFITCIDPEAP